MKKIFSFLLVTVMIVASLGVFTSCGNDNETATSDFKIGFICVHDETSTYDLNFINAAYSIQELLGLKDEQIILKEIGRAHV